MGRFAIMPMLIYENPEINDSEKMLLLLISGLSERNGFCYATNEYLARERKCSVRTVQRQLKKLEALSFLKIDTCKDGYTRRIFICVDREADSYTDSGSDKEKLSSGGDTNVMGGDKNVIGGDTNVMGGDTGVMGGDIFVAEAGVPSDKIINNININKEKEIYKEKESQNESEVFIRLPLKDGEEFAVSENYVKELTSQYPDKEVKEELKLMRAWLLDKPEKERKTLRGINRFIYSWLKRAKASEPLRKTAIYPTAEETDKKIKDFEKEQEDGRQAYLAFKAKRKAMQGGMT